MTYHSWVDTMTSYTSYLYTLLNSNFQPSTNVGYLKFNHNPPTPQYSILRWAKLSQPHELTQNIHHFFLILAIDFNLATFHQCGIILKQGSPNWANYMSWHKSIPPFFLIVISYFKTFIFSPMWDDETQPNFKILSLLKS